MVASAAAGRAGGRIQDIPELAPVLVHSQHQQANGHKAGPRKLLHVVEEWLQKESKARHSRLAAASQQQQQQPVKPKLQSSPYMPSKHMAFFR
jgi:hypothetical protein